MVEIRETFNTYAVIPPKPTDKKQQRRKGERQAGETAKDTREPPSASSPEAYIEESEHQLDEYA